MSNLERSLSALKGFRKEIPRPFRIGLGFGTFLVLLAIWTILSYGGFVKPLFLPTPTSVVKETIVLFKEHNLLSDIGASVFRVVAGFIVSAVVAVPLGLLMGSFRAVNALISPLSSFVRYMPIAAFIPLLILWLGIGDLQKIVLLFLGVFFFLLAMIVDIVSGVQQELLETAYTLGATRRQTILRVLIPASLPGIFDSMRIIVAAAWTYIVVAELVAAPSGLGKMIIESQRFLQTPRVIAGIFIIGLLGLCFDTVFRVSRPLLFPWLEESA